MKDENQPQQPLNEFGRPYPTQRALFPDFLASQFIKDYEEVCSHFPVEKQIIIADHLLAGLKLMMRDWEENFINTKEVFEEYSKMEIAFADQLKFEHPHYQGKQFYQYFDYGLVLSTKDVVPVDKWNQPLEGGQGLTKKEIERFLLLAMKVLTQGRLYIYMKGQPGNSEAEQPGEDKEMTRARQLLTMYFFLRATKVEDKKTPSSRVVRFLHLMTGTKFTTLQNSELYKKYVQMPHYKKGERLIEDLDFIKPYFEDLKLKEAVQMIEEERQRVIEELPPYIRKQYQ
ncbi:MAG: hypothetical protein K1X81_11510 [Bacteroidia bacterium]|nr:hypothetical protein [Bacteroidia bacterium]